MAADWSYNAQSEESETIMLERWPNYNVDLDRLRKKQTCSYNFHYREKYRLKFTITTIIKLTNKKGKTKSKSKNRARQKKNNHLKQNHTIESSKRNLKSWLHRSERM